MPPLQKSPTGACCHRVRRHIARVTHGHCRIVSEMLSRQSRIAFILGTCTMILLWPACKGRDQYTVGYMGYPTEAIFKRGNLMKEKLMKRSVAAGQRAIRHYLNQDTINS